MRALQRIARLYEEVASKLKGMIKVGAVNAVERKAEIQLRTVPQLKLFIDGKKIDYTGSKTT